MPVTAFQRPCDPISKSSFAPASQPVRTLLFHDVSHPFSKVKGILCHE